MIFPYIKSTPSYPTLTVLSRGRNKRELGSQRSMKTHLKKWCNINISTKKHIQNKHGDQTRTEQALNSVKRRHVVCHDCNSSLPAAACTERPFTYRESREKRSRLASSYHLPRSQSKPTGRGMRRRRIAFREGRK